jgi:hypothetical protein
MIENIIEYKFQNNEKIYFKDIDIDDVNIWILVSNNPEGLYELSDKITLDSIELLDKKYKKKWVYNNTDWYKKMAIIITKFDKYNLLKFINHAKKLFIKTFWEEYWNKAYKNFLDIIIIWKNDKNIYNNLIKNDKAFINLLDIELKGIFKYYPNREYKVWFIIDTLYWYWNSYNNENLNNKWESDRYNYWRKYKEKWEANLL